MSNVTSAVYPIIIDLDAFTAFHATQSALVDCRDCCERFDATTLPTEHVCEHPAQMQKVIESLLSYTVYQVAGEQGSPSELLTRLASVRDMLDEPLSTLNRNAAIAELNYISEAIEALRKVYL